MSVVWRVSCKWRTMLMPQALFQAVVMSVVLLVNSRAVAPYQILMPRVRSLVMALRLVVLRVGSMALFQILSPTGRLWVAPIRVVLSAIRTPAVSLTALPMVTLALLAITSVVLSAIRIPVASLTRPLQVVFILLLKTMWVVLLGNPTARLLTQQW